MKENVKYILFALLIIMCAFLIFFSITGAFIAINYYWLYWIVRLFVSDNVAKTIAIFIDTALFMIFFCNFKWK